jgi:hypothetical protein
VAEVLLSKEVRELRIRDGLRPRLAYIGSTAALPACSVALRQVFLKPAE